MAAKNSAWKENQMVSLAILQDSPARLLQGAAVGAVAALAIGFYWEAK